MLSRRDSLMLFPVAFVALRPRGWRQSGNEIVTSFREYLARHLASYKTNNRQTVTLLGGGWVTEFYKPKDETAIDVQTTNSLVSPYLAVGEFNLVRYRTAFHKTKEEAAADNNYVANDETKHRHTYAYQDGKWVPKTRQNYLAILNSWSDCNEVIKTGPNIGATNIHGCWEEVS